MSTCDTECSHLRSARVKWQDMGSRTCPVMLFVTTNGSNPSEQNFLHYGRAPLSFRIDKSCRIKAIAINKEMGSSVMVQQDFNIYTPCGVGLLLKKVCATHDMKRTCMTPSTNMCH